METPISIGRTPLVRLSRFEPRAGVELYAKLESMNPGGSVKDRAAQAIVDDAIKRGRLAGSKDPASRVSILLDATSGNTGIAYAMLGAAHGFLVKLCVPANVTPERKRLLRAYGADVVWTDPMDGSDGAIAEARRLYASNPESFFYADQYNNDANWRAHYETTGPEILEQTDGRVTHFVAGLGTSGTFMGTGRRLRASRPGIELVTVEPDSPLHGLEGLKHMGTAIVPGIYDAGLATSHMTVSTEEAHAITRALARDAGLLVGPSSGAALAASIALARTLDRGVIVTVFPDGGARYLSEPLWDSDTAQLVLPAEARAAIRTHAIAAYPDEACGVLLGSSVNTVSAAISLDNTTDLERRRRFLVGPDEYRRAERHAAESGLEIVGFYHSHPDHPAEPSAFDLEHAWPNLSYAIQSVRNGAARDLRSWRLRNDRSAFIEELID
ncbi:MAG TPA: pyridoxal-phosphate dependent enzyme [Vicinamibacterales bacterium]|nr:pyridoxal-phosphate dependent enzyme [Vicinamibacterales bacterium]